MTYAQVARGRVFYQQHYKDEVTKRKKEEQSLARTVRENYNKESQHDKDAREEYNTIRATAKNANRSSDGIISSSSSSSSSSSRSSISSINNSISTSNGVTKESILLRFKALFSEFNNVPLSKEIILHHFNDLDYQYTPLFKTVLKSITSRSKGIFTLLSNSIHAEPVLPLSKRERTLNTLEELFSTSVGKCLSMQVIVDHFPDMVGDDECTLGEVLRSIAVNRKGQWTHK